MKKKFSVLAAVAFLLTAMLLIGAPAGAQSVDDKIKAVEQELSSLKSQQMELKKEATAAAAALPTFGYRPGNGVNIEAADKSWGHPLLDGRSPPDVVRERARRSGPDQR